ncbi:hypothetical protein CAEBREN_03129 [Caenorhabditis brenneri]|uniref:Uncharacterized protein n=1 Tax=Caenorhabditis brenneri TaxID=135651 RepID=G0MU36_CAEBE|nr:hypothetical protein CAEBREN_03129 [Caenorhabditis brenneri]
MSALEMSMYYVFTHKFTLWSGGYECPPNATKYGAKWPRVGIYCFTSGTVFMFLYLLCFIAVCKSKRFTPAYQLMFTLSIYDMTELSIGSIITGYLTYNGMAFCSAPMFFFLCGSIAMTAWLTSCASCIVLALERCAEVNPRFFLYFLFGKKTFAVVMFVIFIYFMAALLFSKPVIFNPDYSCYLFDPLVGKDIIMQGVILCFFHAAAAITYEFIQFITPPLWLIVMGHVLWQLSCGCLSIAYLTLNRTIRNSVLKMVIPKRIRGCLGLHIGVEEHLAAEMVADGGASVAVINAGGMVVKFDNFFQN